MKKYVLDTSAIINQRIFSFLETIKETKDIEINIPKVVLAELENQANIGKRIGKIGLSNLKFLRILAEKQLFHLTLVGDRPTFEQVKMATGGELDSLIRNEAKNSGATLISSDKIQCSLAKIEGIDYIYLPEKEKTSKYQIEDFFDESTMSIHLIENHIPLAKKGTPRSWKLEKISETPISHKDLNELIHSLLTASKRVKDSNIEIKQDNVFVIQHKQFRIVITKYPFSSKLELTAVRPLVEMDLTYYNLPDLVMKRLEKKAEGILICGAVGSGKSTFASALAKFYQSRGRIVKTLEKPRDLQVPSNVIQYIKEEKDIEMIYDILLLVRPDFVIFDEIRKSRDFEIFADLRLSGIGMIGVVHSSQAIDSIQRFVQRIDIGLLPHIIDFIIFLSKGEVKEILTLLSLVKVPTGMFESDLARPVVEIRNIEGDLLYELYTYGDQTILMDVVNSKRFNENRTKEPQMEFQEQFTNYKFEKGKKNKKHKKH
jgi:ATPase